MARPVVREHAPRMQEERPLAATRTAADAWMEHDFKFAGSHLVRAENIDLVIGATFGCSPRIIIG